jgi:hypothetical protein
MVARIPIVLPRPGELHGRHGLSGLLEVRLRILSALPCSIELDGSSFAGGRRVVRPANATESSERGKIETWTVQEPEVRDTKTRILRKQRAGKMRETPSP